MTTAEITDKVNQIIEEQFNPEIIDLSKTYADYGADSLDIVEVTMAFEEEFGLDIDDYDAERLAELPIIETVIWLKTQLTQ